MKKIIITLIAVTLVLFMQAQTCKIASVEGQKIVQISVDLNSLEGKTLVATVNNNKDSVVLSMAYEASKVFPSANVFREDSSEVVIATKNEEVNISESEVSTEGNEEIEGTNTNSLTVSLLNTVGLGEIGNLIGSITTTNGEPYAEYVARKLTQVDSTKYIPQYKQRKWKWLNRYDSYSTLEIAGIFGKDFGKDSDEWKDDIDGEDYGTDPEKNYNKGGSIKFSQVFIFGYYDTDGKFVPNHLNFGWSVGALFAMDHQNDYGWSWDLLAKLGLQCGNGITLGGDLLFGLGSTPYAIYSTNMVDYRVVFHSQLCAKYGVQGWISMNYGGNTYTSLFARLVKSVVPNSIYDNPTAKNWNNTYVDFDEGSWQIGFAIGYKFGYNSDVRSKRLQASISAGYNLFGADKGGTLLYELEKLTKISPTLNFSYGLGYEQSLSESKFKSLTFDGGWAVKFKPESKFAYMAKFYAGLGEYVVKKSCQSENQQFEMQDTSVRQLCAKLGAQFGFSCNIGCSTVSLSLRGGYHKGLETEYEGYEFTDDSELSGFELTPFVGYTLNF